jgi:ribosomal protein S18 acetylase RimI-like enzyme
MRKATVSDKPVILDLLARSFDDNKSVNYVVKQDENRVERIRRLMDYSFNVCHAFGEVWISDDRRACALILFPDQKRLSFRTLLWDLKLALTVVGINRIRKILKREAMIKSNHPHEPMAYLWFLGVDPQFHGKGIGSTLIQEVMKECDQKKDLFI